MKKSICRAMIFVGFLVVWAAFGGIDQARASLVEGAAIAAVGLIMMFSGYVGSMERR